MPVDLCVSVGAYYMYAHVCACVHMCIGECMCVQINLNNADIHFNPTHLHSADSLHRRSRQSVQKTLMPCPRRRRRAGPAPEQCPTL